MKTTEQKLTGARKKIKTLMEENQQLRRDKSAADMLAQAYKSKAAADNARMKSSAMFVAYLFRRFAAPDQEIIVSVEDLYACAGKDVRFEPINGTNTFRAIVCDKK